MLRYELKRCLGHYFGNYWSQTKRTIHWRWPWLKLISEITQQFMRLKRKIIWFFIQF